MVRRGVSQGIVPEKSRTVLLLIDVINGLDFPGGKQLHRFALPAARNIARLKQRAQKAGVPAIYVNDNFGRWQSDFHGQVEHCLEQGMLGREIAMLLTPEKDDYFVLKPKHSGFFSTTLDILLKNLEAETLILTGFAGDICVLYTANDAYMRDYKIVIPTDCVASETRKGNEYAIAHMEKHLKATLYKSSSVRFAS